MLPELSKEQARVCCYKTPQILFHGPSVVRRKLGPSKKTSVQNFYLIEKDITKTKDSGLTGSLSRADAL